MHVPYHDFRIHLEMDGIISYVPGIRCSSDGEIENCIHTNLTSTLTWDSTSPDFAKQEDSAHTSDDESNDKKDRIILGIGRRILELKPLYKQSWMNIMIRQWLRNWTR